MIELFNFRLFVDLCLILMGTVGIGRLVLYFVLTTKLIEDIIGL